MKRRLDLDVWSQIVRCYSSIGRPIPGLGPNLIHFHCERWRNATMSPCFLKPQSDLERQLRRAESYFRRHKSKHAYDAPAAYINLLRINSDDQDHPLLAAALGLGWKIDPRPSTLNAWSVRCPVALSKSFHFAVGRYFDRAIYRDFLETMAKNFGAKPKFMRELDAMMAGIDGRVRTVLLYHESGKVAAGGLVATHDGGAYLFCGSVCKAYRGKGLWNALVSVRQMVSAEQGAKYWITTTRTPRLFGKGDFSFPLTVITHDSSVASSSSLSQRRTGR